MIFCVFCNELLFYHDFHPPICIQGKEKKPFATNMIIRPQTAAPAMTVGNAFLKSNFKSDVSARVEVMVLYSTLFYLITTVLYSTVPYRVLDSTRSSVYSVQPCRGP